MPTVPQVEKLNTPNTSAAKAPGIYAILRSAQEYWAAMTSVQRRWAGIAGLLLGAAVGGLLWFGLRTDWRTLYADLDPEDSRQISMMLTQAQIPFDVSANGSAIRVPAPVLDKARLAAAAKGGARSGRLGFEIFDKPNWVGSEFDERVNYQRALEGELEHTVASLSDIAMARVHLVMPHESLFREQERPAKASVVLKLRHRALADGEGEAIRNLVASAVDGLSSDRVVLVDAAGGLPLLGNTPDALRLSAEQALEEKLISTLEPVTGAGNVRASVTLDYEAASTEQTEETYDPDQTVTLSMQRSEQTSGPQTIAAGIPGAASNAAGGQPLPVYPLESSSPQTIKNESGSYGASRTVRHTTEAPGRVRRLTAAIVVNHRLIASGGRNGSPNWQGRSADELRNLTTLAEAAIGYDAQRGDLITVQDLAFDENRVPPPPSLWSRWCSQAEASPLLVKYTAFLMAVTILVAFGVRPAVRRLRVGISDGANQNGRALANGNESKPALTGSPSVPDPQRLRAQEIFEQVADHLKREPTHSSRLLQSWIHSDGA